jgi:hypothetical protein
MKPLAGVQHVRPKFDRKLFGLWKIQVAEIATVLLGQVTGRYLEILNDPLSLKKKE